MPEEGILLRDKAEFMSQEELVVIAKKFVDLGVAKIRLTGGEPLIKKNFSAILSQLSKLPVELTITTNGILLDKYFQDLIDANVKSLNISLDSLNNDKVDKISRRNFSQRIFDNIYKAYDLGFNIKLNCVLMKGFNEDEIVDFVELTRNKKFGVRFIEFMPFDGNNWDWSKTISYKQILETIKNHFGENEIQSLTLAPNTTSKNFKIKNFEGNFGIISTITNPFCDTCNRIRLTADGKIKNCLFSNNETDLLSTLRKGESIDQLIFESIQQKHKRIGGLPDFNSPDFEFENRSMIRIGG